MVPVEVQSNRRRIGQLVGAKARRNARVVEAAVPTAFSPTVPWHQGLCKLSACLKRVVQIETCPDCREARHCLSLNPETASGGRSTRME